MKNETTVDFKVRFAERRRGRKSPIKASPPARTPRIAKLMALAIHLEGLIRDGKVKNQAELARLGHVSRPRLTQILNLLSLAPDIQEAILHLEPTISGRDAVKERDLRQVVAKADWRKQREAWSTVMR
jgi:hypothetical protein